MITSLITTQARLAAQSPSPASTKNPYDLLGRVLIPIASVFCPQLPKNAMKYPRALTVTLVLDSMTGVPAALAGTRLEIVLQPPSHVLLRIPIAGQNVTICRDDQEVWIEPRIAAAVLPGQPLNLPALSVKPASVSSTTGKRHAGAIGPIFLPFPPQQLAFLPVLFKVKEAQSVEGARVLDARLMPELARHLGVEEWAARLFVRPAADAKSRPQLSAVEIARPGWHLTLRVEHLEYPGELPAATWQPVTSDALRLTAPQTKRWLEEIGRQMDSSAARP